MARARALDLFHPAVRAWFAGAFPEPTRPQQLGWPAIARGESTLILAPTGSGKTLAAFLWCLNRLMFEPAPPPKERCRVLYISPLKALAVDVERNLRAPLAGIANAANAAGVPVTIPDIAIRTGDTPASERARFLREAADILITTPESLFLLLTSNARERLVHVDTVIIDEIHALVPGKRGAHLALSLERLEALRAAESGLKADTTHRRRSVRLQPDLAAHRPLGDAAAARRSRALPRRRRAAPRRQTTARGQATPGTREGGATGADGRGGSRLHDEFAGEDAAPAFRPVTIVNASEKKQLTLRIEVPVEDIGRSDRPIRSDRSMPSQDPADGRATGTPRSGRRFIRGCWS